MCNVRPSDLNNFSLGKIFSFCKKRQFNNKKYFHMNKTCQNDPRPPSRLKSKMKQIFLDDNNIPSNSNVCVHNVGYVYPISDTTLFVGKQIFQI